MLLDALKWIGGITAVFSLFLVAQQVSDIIGPWMDRYVTAKTLVDAARLQSNSGDYPGAWGLLDEALLLSPGSSELQAERVVLAKTWLRNTWDPADVIPLLPPLYVGAVRGSPAERADALAHIARANMLRSRNGQLNLDIDQQFDAALETDSNNVFALAWSAHWRFERSNRGAYEQPEIEDARRLFAAALANKQRRAWIREVQLDTYLYATSPEAHAEAMRVVSELMAEGGAISSAHAQQFKRNVHDLVVRKDATAEALRRAARDILTWDDLHTTYEWVVRMHPSKNAMIERYALANLSERAGDSSGALAAYRALLDDAKTGYSFSRDLTDAVDRLSQ